jgi:hypothetical protein
MRLIRATKRLAPALFVTALVTPVASLPAQAVSGTGQHATSLFPLAAGLAVFELEHEGDGAFIVRLMSDSGAVIDTLARASGPFRGAKAARVPATGLYLYDVSARGRWSIRLRSVAAMSDADRATAEAREAGAAAGAQAAREEGTTRWLLGGFAGGAVLGPLGAGGVFLAANSRASTLSPDVRELVSGQDPHYVQAFSEAYLAGKRSSRKRAAVVGGTVGTIVFTFAMIQIARWNDEGGGSGGNGGGEVP